MAIPAPIGSIKPVHQARMQNPAETQTANADRYAAMQQQYDQYNTTVYEYNSAADIYRRAEESYNAAYDQLAEAEGSGNSAEIQSRGIKVAGTADALNTALENLREKETAYNNSLLSLVNAGLISSDVAASNEIHNTYNRLDVGKLRGDINNVVSNVDVVNNYNTALSNLKSEYAKVNDIANRYNAATTDEERNALTAEYNNAVEQANSAVTEYNIAFRMAQDYNYIDKEKTEEGYIPKIIPAGPAPQIQSESESKIGSTIYGTFSNIARDLGESLKTKAETAKFNPGGIGIGGFIAANVFTGALGNSLVKAADAAEKLDNVSIQIRESFLGATDDIREGITTAGQWINPTDENLISVREGKLSAIDAAESVLQGSALSDIGAGVGLKESDNPIMSALGTSMILGGSLRNLVIGGGADVAREVVSEAKTGEEQRQQTIANYNTIADAIGNIGDNLPSAGGRFLADTIESGIRMDADYVQYGLFDSEGNFHSPGLISGAATALVGGAIGATVGAVGVPTLSAAKSLVGDLLGTGGGAAGLSMEGLSTQDYLASRGAAGAGRGAGAVATVNANAESINAANIVGMSMLGNNGINRLTEVDFSDELVYPTNNNTRNRSSNSLGGVNSIFDDMLDEYPTRERTRNNTRNRNEGISLNNGIFDEEIGYREPTRESTNRRYISISDSIFGNRLDYQNRDENWNRNDYIYEYEYPTRPAPRRTRELDWDDDDMLTESRSRKRKSSRNSVWREILRI